MYLLKGQLGNLNVLGLLFDLEPKVGLNLGRRKVLFGLSTSLALLEPQRGTVLFLAILQIRALTLLVQTLELLL